MTRSRENRASTLRLKHSRPIMILHSQARLGSIFYDLLCSAHVSQSIQAMAGIEDPEMSHSVILCAVTTPFSGTAHVHRSWLVAKSASLWHWLSRLIIDLQYRYSDYCISFTQKHGANYTKRYSIALSLVTNGCIAAWIVVEELSPVVPEGMWTIGGQITGLVLSSQSSLLRVFLIHSTPY